MNEFEYAYLEDGTKILKGEYFIKRLIKGHEWDIKLNEIIDGLSEFDIEVPYFPFNLTLSEKRKLDRKYKYAFDTHSFKEYKESINESNQDYYNFAICKWFNLKIHDLVLGLFLTLKKTHIEFNDSNTEVDLFINKLPIDIKTAKFPCNYFNTKDKGYIIEQLRDERKRKWFLEHEYKQDYRKDIIQNRLYILYHNSHGSNFKEPRYDLGTLKYLGKEFIENCTYDEIEIKGKKVKVGIIIISNDNPRSLENLPTHEIHDR